MYFVLLPLVTLSSSLALVKAKQLFLCVHCIPAILAIRYLISYILYRIIGEILRDNGGYKFDWKTKIWCGICLFMSTSLLIKSYNILPISLYSAAVSLSPIITTFMAYIILDERIEKHQLIGSVITITGAIIPFVIGAMFNNFCSLYRMMDMLILFVGLLSNSMFWITLKHLSIVGKYPSVARQALTEGSLVAGGIGLLVGVFTPKIFVINAWRILSDGNLSRLLLISTVLYVFVGSIYSVLIRAYKMHLLAIFSACTLMVDSVVSKNILGEPFNPMVIILSSIFSFIGLYIYTVHSWQHQLNRVFSAIKNYW